MRNFTILSIVFYISNMLKNFIGIFSRVHELRNDPLLADIYEDMTDINNYRSVKNGGNGVPYIGPERDRENFRKDIQNWRTDFGKAFQATKIRLGV